MVHDLVDVQTTLQAPINAPRPPGTPENDIMLLDEPSSTLASRIMRAHDNPSPPPNASPKSHRLIDISEPTTPYRSPSSTNHVASSVLSPTWGPPPLKPLYTDITSQRDLIVFDVGELAATASKSHSSAAGNPLSISKAVDPGMPEASVDDTPMNVLKNICGEISDRLPDNQAPHVIYSSNLQTKDSHADPSLSTPVRPVDRLHSEPICTTGHLDSPTATVSPTVNQESQSSRKYSLRVALEKLPVEQFTIPHVDEATAFDTSGVFPPDSLVPTADRRHPPSVGIPYTLNSVSTSKHSKSLMSTEATSTPTPSTTQSSSVSKTPPKALGDSSSSRGLRSVQPPRPPLFADPPQTPARRMLVEEVPPSHTKFPSMSSKSTTLGFPRTPVFHIPPTDSPARRMLVEDKSHNLHQVSASNSPARLRQNRSQSVEPTLPRASLSRAKVRSTSVEPPPVLQQGSKRSTTFFKPLTIDRPKNKLPFPLVSEVIPEENVKEPRTAVPKPHSSSSLKRGVSRIPRIGSKPYARPTATSAIRADANKHISIPQSNNTNTSNPLRPPGHANLNKSRITKSMTNCDLAVDLKRKRSSEDISNLSKASRINAQNHKPMTLQIPNATRVLITSELPGARSEDKVEVAQQLERQSNVNDTTPSLQHAPAEYISEQSLIPPLEKQQTSPYIDPPSTSRQLAVTEAPIDEHNERNSSTETQRTTRTRKKVQSATGASRSRRKTGNVSAPIRGDVFSGMTAVALKTLTNANTVRNQQYIATRLETEVIRKPGPRPTSPVKVQTVLQRTQDEKSRERRERAQRRAQRIENVQNRRYSESEEEADMTFEAPNFDIREEDHANHDSHRHRRGAGDDEDYKTPERQLKKLKLTDNLENKEGRRVNWDKSLFKAVYLDEVQLGRRPLCKDSTSRKGCLALTSKAVELDTMGNLPNASAPVMDLVEESISVKKFVYDDDIEENPPISKSTRSKRTKAS
ncbi:hypothetical protein APHAL10511_001194 [Amanita phalloides]|nr:hypothetical protein APHAL10511_001194 [Amanita phalloides]